MKLPEQLLSAFVESKKHPLVISVSSGFTGVNAIRTLMEIISLQRRFFLPNSIVREKQKVNLVDSIYTVRWEAIHRNNRAGTENYLKISNWNGKFCFRWRTRERRVPNAMVFSSNHSDSHSNTFEYIWWSMTSAWDTFINVALSVLSVWCLNSVPKQVRSNRPALLAIHWICLKIQHLNFQIEFND